MVNNVADGLDGWHTEEARRNLSKHEFGARLPQNKFRESSGRYYNDNGGHLLGCFRSLDEVDLAAADGYCQDSTAYSSHRIIKSCDIK